MVQDVVEPTTLDEACAALAEYGESAKLIAGGTALVLLMRQRLLLPDRLIALHRLPLAAIEEAGPSVALGALATHAQIAESDLVRRHYPALSLSFAGVGSPRIRNLGTIGGNLAQGDPHLDPPVALLALGATITIRANEAEREIAADDFFIDYFETALGWTDVITSVRVPARTARTGLSFVKYLTRSKDDYAAVDVAVWVRTSEQDTIDDVHVALGSVGPRVFRAHVAEDALKGSRPTTRSLSHAGDEAARASSPDSDVRGSSSYKRDLIRVLLPRAVMSAVGDAARRQPAADRRSVR